MLKNPQFFRNNIKKIRYLLSKLFPDRWDTLYIIQVSPPLTRFSNNMVFSIARFVLVLSFVHSVLNQSSAYMVFCLHGCFSKVSKNSVSRGTPVIVLVGMTAKYQPLWIYIKDMYVTQEKKLCYTIQSRRKVQKSGRGN